MSVNNQINSIINTLYLDIQDLQNKLALLPKGDLFCETNGKYIKWYKKNSINTHKPIYIPKKERAYAEALALRKYYSTQITRKSNQILLLKKYLMNENKLTENPELFLDDSSLFKPLLLPQFCHINKDINNWINSDYEKNPRYHEHLIHKTLSGNYVRSKSEAIIANSLFINNIPYRYENALNFEDVIFYPDFTIKHPKTFQVFYWEHFGMMDNPSYYENTYNKLKIYAHNKIIPTINLITTYETQKNPIDSTKIEQLIKEFFL